ncbi:hypothetical protein J2Z76_002507 [Sedimentibacter acidaminivorans]|uniref:DUF4179 domain-containing protein n=1 Tax=Sedimentibacter acidaminivorans TaxID=913099 RepID=A0ABS4GG20_9FIRM|nr:DUF4179 domain-containing protein [Sedimentibacter acidaminivorans]MBP1926638.1 hypothetical protein [Sedimentibacter acidaminivorans]
MGKIDELLDDYDIKNEKLNINEIEMSKEEVNRIKETTMLKTGFSYKYGTKKKYIIPLAAVMTIILSFAVVFAQGGLSNIYNKIFGENIKYVNDMGTIIDESYSSNGITLNVASMVGDENSFYIVFELIKENGESFGKSDYIYIEHLRLEMKGSGGYSWNEIKDDNPNDSKATFILVGNTEKKTAGDKLTLLLSEITEYSINKQKTSFEPYDFLMANQEYVKQYLIKNDKKSPVNDVEDNMSEDERKKINEMNDITPDEILPINNLSILLGDNLNNLYVDNVGFAEGKLCIRFALKDSEKRDISEIYFTDKSNSDDRLYSNFMFSQEANGIKYEYYIFDIQNMEELKNYNLTCSTTDKINVTKGDWKVSFKADYKNITHTIKVNKDVQIEGKRYTIKNIKISPISLNVQMRNNLVDNIENPVHKLHDILTVTMKDGTEVEIGSSGTSTNPLTATLNLIFTKPVDVTQIDKITVGDLEIELN